MTDTQPDALAAFLAGAEYHILQAPKGVTEDTSEPLAGAGTYYAPLLFKAVQAVLELAGRLPSRMPPSTSVEVYRREVAGLIRAAITRELLGEGE